MAVGVDRTIALDVNGFQQHIRLCASRAGLPPLLVVQGGPALPLFHEVAKFQRLLDLERDFLVAYWEPRGCGNASRQDATRTSFEQQIEDLRTVLQWLHHETNQPIVVLGISIGATIAMLAIEQESDRVKALIAVSPDSNTALSDATAHAFLKERGRRTGDRRLRRRIEKLPEPPYLDATSFQQRARLLADLGTIETGKTFGALFRETLFAMIRTYGVVGTLRALRNMSIVLRKILPGVASVDLLGRPPRLRVPVHYIFGEQDALTPALVVERLPASIASPGSTVTQVANAGHMAHFDQPHVVRSIAQGL
jgi:pimeloyl-ACP methyl ester carboxylesterase